MRKKKDIGWAKVLKRCERTNLLEAFSCEGLYYGSAHLGKRTPAKKGTGIFVFTCEGHTLLMTRPYLKRMLKAFKDL